MTFLTSSHTSPLTASGCQFQHRISACPGIHDSLHNYLCCTFHCFSSQEEQEYSAQQSASINRAYSTLLKPYSRGLYLVCQLPIQLQHSLPYAPNMECAVYALEMSMLYILLGLVANCHTVILMPSLSSKAVLLHGNLTLPFLHVSIHVFLYFSIPMCLYSFLLLNNLGWLGELMMLLIQYALASNSLAKHFDHSVCHYHFLSC